MNTMPSARINELKLITPKFDSELTTLILELEPLRTKRVQGMTHPELFEQLSRVFRMLESISSARIEGNDTSIQDYMNARGNTVLPPRHQEIHNMETAMEWLDNEITEGFVFNKAMLFELHKKIMHLLPPPPEGEGDRTPGKYRTTSSQRSSHASPEAYEVPFYMDELFEFINKPVAPQYKLIKVATAHHRFAWIRPFNNGNGRTVRLLTYAMLVEAGFSIKNGRIATPAAIFSAYRHEYYQYLSHADSGTEQSMAFWCEYLLEALMRETLKVDLLLNYPNIAFGILLPAIEEAHTQSVLTKEEFILLKQWLEHGLPSLPLSEIEKMTSLKQKNLIIPDSAEANYCTLSFENEVLLPFVIKQLNAKGFLAFKEIT